jgi:hypothetical protein
MKNRSSEAVDLYLTWGARATSGDSPRSTAEGLGLVFSGPRNRGPVDGRDLEGAAVGVERRVFHFQYRSDAPVGGPANTRGVGRILLEIFRTPLMAAALQQLIGAGSVEDPSSGTVQELLAGWAVACAVRRRLKAAESVPLRSLWVRIPCSPWA